MQLVIESDGGIRCVYSESINLAAFGRLTITRGSHVEPDDEGYWYVDLSPVEGPRLGPFVLRSRALTVETAWLDAHWLVKASSL